MAEQLEPIMLDPTRHRKNLAMFESSQGFEGTRGIEAVGLAACGPLIDGNNGGHAYFSMKSTVMCPTSWRGRRSIWGGRSRSGNNFMGRLPRSPAAGRN